MRIPCSRIPMNKIIKKDEKTLPVDDNVSESYVNVGTEVSGEMNSNIVEEATDRTISELNAQRLKDSDCPAEMAKVLFAVWKRPSTTSSPFVLDDGEGAISDIDIAKCLFYSDSICKKLVRFIGYLHTSVDAKAAAMAVFTWFCTQPALCKSLMIDNDAIIGWVMDLALDKNPTVALTGIKGLLTLYRHERYRQRLGRNTQICRLLNVIDMESESSQQHLVQCFKLLHSMMSSSGVLVEHEQVLTRLLQLADDYDFKTVEEQYWCASCLQSGITLSSRAIQLMSSRIFRTLTESMHSEALERLLDDRINMYISLMRNVNSESIALHSWIKDQTLCKRLMKRIEDDSWIERSTAIDLLALIVQSDPVAFFEGYLDSSWNLLQKLLEIGTVAEKQQILNMYIAMSSTMAEKKTIPCEDGGEKILQLLSDDITIGNVQVMLFIWKQFSHVIEAFVKAETAPRLVSVLFGNNSQISVNLRSKIHMLLCAFMQDNGEFGTTVNDLLRQRLITEIASVGSQKREALSTGWLEFFKLATCGPSVAKTIHWLIEDGYELATRCGSGSSVDDLIQNILETSVPAEKDLDYVLKKLTLVLCLLQGHRDKSAFGRHDWKADYCRAKEADLPVPQIMLSSSALCCLTRLITSSLNVSPLPVKFLRFLFHILVKVGLEQATEPHKFKDLRASLLECVRMWTKDLAQDPECSVRLLQGLAMVVSDESDIGWMQCYTTDTQVLDKLWSVFERHGLSELLGAEYKKKVMMCLRTFAKLTLEYTQTRMRAHIVFGAPHQSFATLNDPFV